MDEDLEEEVKYYYRNTYLSSDKLMDLKQKWDEFDYTVGEQFDKKDMYCFSIELTTENYEEFLRRRIESNNEDIYVSLYSNFESGGFTLEPFLLKILKEINLSVEVSYLVDTLE